MVSSLVLCRAALRRAVTPPPFLPPQMQAALPEQQQVHCWSLILLEVPSGQPLPAAAAIVFKSDSCILHVEVCMLQYTCWSISRLSCLVCAADSAPYDSCKRQLVFGSVHSLLYCIESLSLLLSLLP